MPKTKEAPINLNVQQPKFIRKVKLLSNPLSQRRNYSLHTQYLGRTTSPEMINELVLTLKSLVTGGGKRAAKFVINMTIHMGGIGWVIIIRANTTIVTCGAVMNL